jgi:hypothetical protein
LLQAVYPGLSAVEGGHDFGRDGDIYFTIEGSGGRLRIGRLLATIDDPRENARSGLSRIRGRPERGRVGGRDQPQAVGDPAAID